MEKRNFSAFQRNKFLLDPSKNDKVTGVQNRAVGKPICHGHHGKEPIWRHEAACFSTLKTVHLHTFRPAGAGDRQRPIRVASFSVQISTCTVRCPCLLCSDTRRRSRVLKDNDWCDVTRTFKIGELRGSELLSTDSGLSRWVKVVVFGWETGWRPILKLLVPTLAKQAHLSSPCTACCLDKKKNCEAFTQFLRRCRSSALTKKKSVTPA